MIPCEGNLRAHAPSSLDCHAADREQLIRIFREIEASINSRSLEACPRWANAEFSHGPAEVLAHYDRMVKARAASSRSI